MYTKSQFNKLLKTRKHWTGQQIGRMLVQATIQQMNGKTPFVDSEKDLAPLVNQLAYPKDISDYGIYAKLSSGFIGAWNYVEALGNDARASLGFLQSIIQNFTDWANAEINNQRRPVVLTQKQYDEYKKKFEAIIAKEDKSHCTIKSSIADVLLHAVPNKDYLRGDGRYMTIRQFGKNATQVINDYKSKTFSTDDISFLRNFIQDHHYVPEKRTEIASFDKNKILTDIYSINSFARFPRSKRHHLNGEISAFLKRQYLHNKRDGITKIAKNYLTLLFHEALVILHQEKITYDDALVEAVKKYPYSHKSYELTHPELAPYDKEQETVPYVPASLTYADLLGANQETTQLADIFWGCVEISEEKHGHDQQVEDFVRQHFWEFFKASKKDLIEAHPKVDELFNKVTNSTSLIIPLISWQSLADAGIETFQEFVEDSQEHSVNRITDVFPKRIRYQAIDNGIAILVPGSRSSLFLSHETDEEAIAKAQHYELKPFVMDGLTDTTNKERISKAINSIKYYVVVQATYVDYIKGIAKFTNNSGLNKYSKTPAFDKLQAELKLYDDSLLVLMDALSRALDNKDDQVQVNSAITQSFPLISLECEGYEHKPVDELAKIIEDRYTNYDAIDVFEIINTIAEGAPDYE